MHAVALFQILCVYAICVQNMEVDLFSIIIANRYTYRLDTHEIGTLNVYTVQPVHEGHSRDPENETFMSSCTL